MIKEINKVDNVWLKINEAPGYSVSNNCTVKEIKTDLITPNKKNIVKCKVGNLTHKFNVELLSKRYHNTDNLPGEIFYDIEGYKKYELSSLLRLRNKKTRNILNKSINNYINMTDDTGYYHQRISFERVFTTVFKDKYHLIDDSIDKKNIKYNTSKNLHSFTKAIYQINLKTKEIIKKFKDVSQASKELKISNNAIYKVCNNWELKAGGFGWTYVMDQENNK